MGIFPNTQGQVTHKSLVGSCQISNQSEILLGSLLPALMKKIQPKMKALESSQHYSLIFQTLKGSSDGNLLKFKLKRAVMVGLVTCKNGEESEDPSKNEGTRVVKTFLPL